ncbi:hypothetical protein ACJIZ3_010270 [Penstemon smallii]|uniref:Protein TOO MANY MOUTHS n=1 Tax=Penstemon smallii TaxID=265156 RepID=A0ABD3TEV9_9LAMI
MSDSALVDGPQSGLSNSNDASRTDPKEQEAVYNIMRATGNEWATEIPDVCRGRWHGIECMPDKDNVLHVVSLSFGALSDDTAFPTCDSTRSFISPSIVELPHLRTLLGSNLQTLVLRENGHVGEIPFQIGNLTHLTVLDLHKNNLNGSIPSSLGRITGLRSFDLSGNRLSGSIPNISLPELSVLDLNQNHLSGSIPTSLFNCKSLIKIDLSRNRISGSLPKLRGLEELILLDLSYNTLTENPFAKPFENLKSLQALILNGNPLMFSTIPEEGFRGLDNLMILGLSNMNLEGGIPESFGLLTKLRVLHLDGNKLNGTIPSSFGYLNGLSELRLDNNRLNGPVPFKREVIWRMRRKLRLENNLGLCFDARSGLGDHLDLLSDAGIGQCETTTFGPTVSVQHVSTVTNSGHKIITSEMIGLSAVFWFVLLLFCEDI